MITEGEAAIPLERTRRAFRNQSQSKQRSAFFDENVNLLRNQFYFQMMPKSVIFQ